MPSNVCVPLFKGGDKDLTYRTTAPVVGKTFAAVQAAGIQSGPEITTTALPSTWDGGNLQAATCAAGAKADGVFAYDQVSGQVVPVIGHGNVVPVTAGAAITAGQEIEVGANGRAIPYSAGIKAGKAESNQSTTGSDVYVRLY